MLVGPKKNPVEILTPEDIAKLPQQEQHKWEIAAELGLFDKIIEQGWEALTARESGRIGGMLAADSEKEKVVDIPTGVYYFLHGHNYF